MGRERIVNEIGAPALDLVQRLERLLGYRVNLSDGIVDAVRARAEQLEDPAVAEDAATAIMNALYPGEDPPREWWSTEAGLMCARSIGYHRPTAPLVQAAWILNVSRQRVHQLCDEERLIRMDVPRDGVTRWSLRQELLSHGRRQR